MTIEPEQFAKRFKDAESLKINWDQQFWEALGYVNPTMNTYDQVIEGQKKNSPDKVFDSTAQNAIDGFIANLQSTLFPPYKQWLKLRCGRAIPQEQREDLDKKLEDITNTVFDYIRISNFDTQISTAFGDYAFGVGTLMVTKGTKQNPLYFTAVPVGNTFLENGPLGRVDTVFRRTHMPIRNIMGTWDDAVLSDDMQSKLESNGGEKVCLLEGVIGDNLHKRSGDAVETVGDYEYVVMEEKSKFILVQRTMKSSPWVVFRWPGLPGEVYSRGPVLKALADIKTLNKAKELLLKRGSRDLYGVYTYTDDGVLDIDNITFGATCFLPVEYNGGARGASIMPLPPTGDMNLAQFIFNDYQQGIFKAMFAEPLGRVDLPVKTATEIAYRQQELAKKIGAAFGKLQYELMIPLINRILYILNEMELIDIGPFQVDGQIINIEYMSPLALAQDQEDLMNAQTYAQMMINTFGPNYGMAMIDPENFSKYCGNKLHIPDDLRPSAQDFAVFKQALMRQGMQMAANGGGGLPAPGNASGGPAVPSTMPSTPGAAAA